MMITTTGATPAAAYMGVRLGLSSAPLFCKAGYPSSVGSGDDESSVGITVGVGDT